MLVVTRKSGEQICLGDDVTITVLEISGSTVRLGIEAPSDVPIFRGEIWAEVQAENRAAASVSIDAIPPVKNRSDKAP